MDERKLLIATGVGCFVVFALAFIPARVISGIVPAEAAKLTDMSGTLWSGNVQSVEVGGIQLRDVNWELHAFALLIGRLSLTIDAKWGSGYVRGDVGAGIGGSLRFRDVQVLGPLAPVLRQLNLGGSGGDLAIEVAALDIADEWPTQIVGSARVARVPLNMLGIPGGTSGNYSIEFDIEDVADDGVIPGVLSDDGGPLEVFGELRLTPPRDYAIQARVKARPEAPAELANGLMLVGPKTPDGSHEFEMAGSL